MADPVVAQLDKTILQYALAPADRFVYSLYFKALTVQPIEANPGAADRIEVLKQLLSSELGYLFFDRTRIRPKTFVIGEHVFTLSLAPGEEVVLEQKTFSQRQTTLEDQTEQEQQVDLELASTLSTELTVGVERQQNRSEQSGFSAGGSLGGNLEGVEVKADASYSQNVSEANTTSRTRSLKDASTATSKVASKYRSLHKTTFKVATEDRFESSSRRVLRNPNRYTPIDLHYFKVMRQFDITQERYAARVCWAPAVENPAGDLLLRIAIEQRARIDAAVAKVQIPPRPVEPPLPHKDPKTAQSEVTDADKWGFTGDMSADYDVPIDIPDGYVWDGDTDQVARLTEVWGRKIPSEMGWHIVGTPTVRGDQLIVKIHVGAGSWIAGPKIYMQAKARFVPPPPADDPEYQKKYDAWQAALAQWEADKEQRLDGPRRQAEIDADAWRADLLATFNPVLELMGQIAKKRGLVGELSNEAWEVDFWGQIFDWERAGLALYPGWWSNRPPRDDLRQPDDFLNASWAKLYLPIKPGFERLGLRWIVGKVQGEPLDAPTEQRFQAIIDDLRAYREVSFGDESEIKLGGQSGLDLQQKFLTLGRWAELLPTDGTHIEVVQSMTSAADDLTKADLDDLRRVRTAQAAGEEQDVELKKRAVTQVGATGKPFNVDVVIATEGAPDTNGR